MSERSFRLVAPLRAIACLVALFAPEALAQAPAGTWDARFWNPKPAADDLILPMPCGAAMAFRPVALPAETPLADNEVRLGDSLPAFAFTEGSRAEFLGGSFGDPKQKARRLFYLGKYEVTQDQLAALGPTCPAPQMDGRRPAGGVTWAEAVRFADGYTTWILANAADKLPREDGSAGFLRLPTEAEWEFAARGGVAVSPTDFAETVFPMPEGINGYVWFAGSGSSRGRAQPVGLKLPNPLGLYDMLGNIDELVLDPFRVNRLDRLHGQAGGAMAKGGNYLTPESEIRSAYRQEILPFDAKGPRRVATVGFRLAISAPVLTSPQRLRQLIDEWQRLAASDASPALGSQALEDPLKELEAITAAARGAELQRRLQGLSLVIKANIESRNRQRDLAARGFVRLGAFIAQKIADDLVQISTVEGAIRRLKTLDTAPETIQRMEAGLGKSRGAMEHNLAYYSDLVIDVSRSYPPAVLDAQLNALVVDLREKKIEPLVDFATLFVENTKEYQKTKKIDRDGIFRRLRR